MSLWRTWEVCESFTFFVSAKEYRSKTDVARIKKTNTNVACNYCQAKYENSKGKTTDLLQGCSSDDLHSINVDWYGKKSYFRWFHIFEMQRTESVIQHLLHNNCTPNYAWVLSGNTRMITLNCQYLKNRTYLLRPSLGHIWTRCAFIDNFEFATNKAFHVCLGMSMLFWLGGFLKSRR